MNLSLTPPVHLYTLLAQGMGPDLHWFPEDISVSRLAAVLVGMANAEGGVVLLGIAPRSGQVVGLKDPAAAIDRVFQAALLIDPPLVLPAPVVTTPGGTALQKVMWITVPAGLPNVYSLEGRYLGRDGRQTNPLTPRRLRELLIERGAIQIEGRVPPGATLDDLDPEKVHEYVENLVESGLLPRFDSQPGGEHGVLLRRCLLQMINGTLYPTYAALLLFGNYPQQWLPNATILAARFSGPTLADQFIKQDISGTLPEQLRQAEAFLAGHLRRQVSMDGLAHRENLEYPMEAVRELLVNAVSHRDYNIQGDNIHLYIFNDRLEVHSPGGLPGPMTLENLLEARFSRNAILVQVLADMGFVERLGYGLDRVVAVMREHNLRLPRFEEIAGGFRVTLLATEEAGPRLPVVSYATEDLNQRQRAALAYLGLHRRITSGDYQQLCPEVHSETLRRDLADLARRGLLIKVGDKRATYYILKKAP